MNDEARKLVIPGDFRTTVAFAVFHFLSAAKNAIDKHGSFAVALSGGSTPKPIYELLTSPPNLPRIDWSKVFLFWSDERAVPPDHPESNFHMAMKAGFNRVPIPEGQIFRMVAEKEIEKSAASYEETLKKVLKGRPLDLVLLGMGEDGHTASLFPGTKALDEKTRWVVANEVPQHATQRMTLTFPAINASTQAVFYVMGAGKKYMLSRILSSKEMLPCQRVGTAQHPSLWIADEAAAAQVLAPHVQA